MIVLTAWILGALFTISIYVSIFFRTNKIKKVQLLDWFLLSLGTFNGIGFAFVMWATYNGKNLMSSSYYMMDYDFIDIFNYLSLNIIFAISVLCGWYMKNILKYNKRKKLSKMKLSNGKGLSNNIIFKISLVGLIMLIVSILAYYIYCKPYGGFEGIFYYKKAIRAGVSNVYNPFSFLKKFGSFSFFSSFIFFGIIIDKKINNRYNLKNILGLIVSLIFSLYVLYTWEGRVSIVIYILTFIFALILYKNKNIMRLIRKLIIFTVIGIILISSSDAILGSSESKISTVEMLSKELTFPFISYIGQVENTSFRWFIDFIATPLYILPQSLWSSLFKIETASTFNTYILLGARKGEFGVSGEMPIDILTFSYIQAPIIGVIIVGISLGYILNVVEAIINNIPVKGLRVCVYSNIALYGAILSVLYGDPEHIVTRNFHNIIGLFMIWMFSKSRIKRIKIKYR